jgi:hypothetical protein
MIGISLEMTLNFGTLLTAMKEASRSRKPVNHVGGILLDCRTGHVMSISVFKEYTHQGPV